MYERINEYRNNNRVGARQLLRFHSRNTRFKSSPDCVLFLFYSVSPEDRGDSTFKMSVAGSVQILTTSWLLLLLLLLFLLLPLGAQGILETLLFTLVF
jgi:hypothetical protein